MDEHEFRVLELYELKLIVTETILECAAAEGYINRGERNPWPLIPWSVDKKALMRRVERLLRNDPHWNKLKLEQHQRAYALLRARMLGEQG